MRSPYAQLVVDAAPLLASTASAQSLRSLARSLVTTRAVLNEVRDKTSRELLERIGFIDAAGRETDELTVREPSIEAVARVSAFAKQTGDIAVLSKTDLAVLALTLTLELEAHGSSRLRLAPGKESDYEREQSHAAFLARDAKRRAKEAATGTPTVATVVQQLDELSTADEPVEEQEAADTAAAAEDELDDGEWITPDNVDLHKSRDLGFFPALDPTATPEPDPTDAPADETLVGCMTGDFAMQNVLLQMGMEVVGVGGKRVSQVRTWVLRCHACFKLCKDPTRKFCPSCGNPTLLRTSVTYVRPSPAHPQGYILHLKANYRFNNRGTVFSIPAPLPKSSRGQLDGRTDLILREDQKEWQRGVRRSEIAKRKDDKALAKALADPNAPESRFGSAWADPDRPARAISGDPRGERVGADGLPIVGFGRRNPNAARRGGRR